MGLASWVSACPQVSAELESDQRGTQDFEPLYPGWQLSIHYGADVGLVTLCEDLFGDTFNKRLLV